MLTRYEFVRVYALRLEQLSHMVNLRGGFVEVTPDMTATDILHAELRARALPYVVKRTIPNGGPVCIRVCDADFPREFDALIAE